MKPLHETVQTLGALKESNWESRSVKEEMRRNLIHKVREGETLFPGILGYDQTVIPQLQHAILSKHDLILLGLRGQAKSRILRMLVNFLDEYMPIIEGSEINDDPLNPISKYALEKIDEQGDDTPIEWVHRSERYGEKLATPDTTVADLIGDIDPIKAATHRLTLADQNVINFGLVPRTNRGIFAINELPDLQPRIQVALLNIMQERDIQIRGFQLRIPLDTMMAFSANPEDYTNRGNIITPLKDRIDAQIITHYPKTRDVGMQITQQEAWMNRDGDVQVHIPGFVKEVIEQAAFEARNSEYVDQKSGVSTRMTITAMESAVSAAERRALANGEEKATLRITDLYHMVPALTGKLELVYEGEQEGAYNVARHVIGRGVSTIFKSYFPDPQHKQSRRQSEKHEASEAEEKSSIYDPIVNWFASGNSVELTDDMDDDTYRKTLKKVKGLEDVLEKADGFEEEPDHSVAMEFVLEALHQNSMLGKEDLENTRTYTDMLGSMLGGMGDIDDIDDWEE